MNWGMKMEIYIPKTIPLIHSPQYSCLPFLIHVIIHHNELFYIFPNHLLFFKSFITVSFYSFIFSLNFGAIATILNYIIRHSAPLRQHIPLFFYSIPFYSLQHGIMAVGDHTITMMILSHFSEI